MWWVYMEKKVKTKLDMNKLERKLKGEAKFKKRLKNIGYTPEVLARLKRQGVKMKLYCFKSTGKPCSCMSCSPSKVEEKAKYRLNKFDKNNIDEDLV